MALPTVIDKNGITWSVLFDTGANFTLGAASVPAQAVPVAATILMLQIDVANHGVGVNSAIHAQLNLSRDGGQTFNLVRAVTRATGAAQLPQAKQGFPGNWMFEVFDIADADIGNPNLMVSASVLLSQSSIVSQVRLLAT